MSNNIKRFKLHWLDGSTTIVNGYDIKDAFTMAGYGGGAVRALDYWEEIENKKDNNNKDKGE